MTLAQWSDGLVPTLQKRDFIDGRKHAFVSEGDDAYAIVDFSHYALTHQDLLDIAQVKYGNANSTTSAADGDQLEKRITLADEVRILTIGGGTDPFTVSTTWGGVVATATLATVVGLLLIGWKYVSGGGENDQPVPNTSQSVGMQVRCEGDCDLPTDNLMNQALESMVTDDPNETGAVYDFDISEVCVQAGCPGVPVTCAPPMGCPIPIYPRSAKGTWCNDADGTGNGGCSN